MSAQDPLSEALELAGELLSEAAATAGLLRISDEASSRERGNRLAAAVKRARTKLARLDALPEPYPDQIGRLDNVGWFYPDAPVARDDGGEDA